MSIGYSSWVDSIKILMYSMMGDSILSGKGSIIEILFDIDNSAVAGDSTLLHLKDVTLSDPHAQSISVNIVDGWFHFVTPEGIEENQPGDKMPPVFRLYQNSPNPFVFATNIRYQLPVESDVSLKIYSHTGQLVRTLESTKKRPGYYIVNWKGCNDKASKVAAGIYFCKLEVHTDPGIHTGRETGDYKAIKKIILLR